MSNSTRRRGDMLLSHLLSSSCSFALGCSPCSIAFPFGKCSSASCSEMYIRVGAISLQPVSGEGCVCGGDCVSRPAGTRKPNHLVSHREAALAWAGTNFKCVQGSSRGCQAVICGWLCFLSMACCSLSGNAKWSKSQAAAKNASISLF